MDDRLSRIQSCLMNVRIMMSGGGHGDGRVNAETRAIEVATKYTSLDRFGRVVDQLDQYERVRRPGGGSSMAFIENRIPNVIHFTFGMSNDFGEKPFSLIHWLAIESAIAVNNPAQVFLYYTFEPSGAYWRRLNPLVTARQIPEPREVFGRELRHHAHKADVCRLKTLIKYGGIYMDLDTISKRSLDDFRKYPCVLGREGSVGLCNAVILAEKNADFLNLWLESYATFDSSEWNHHSVILPAHLANLYPSLLHVASEKAFHYPLYSDPDLLFEECHDFRDAYVHHLWEQALWDRISSITEMEILCRDSTYNLIARRYL